MTESFVHRGITIERHGRRWRWRMRTSTGRTVRSYVEAREARQQLDRFLDRRERTQRQFISGRRITISQLCTSWLTDRRPRIAPGTFQQYEIQIRVHISPAIGGVEADLIRPLDLEAFFSTLRWKSAKESHNVLRQAFEWALRNELLSRPSNPCLTVTPSRRACVDHDGLYDDDDRHQAVDEKEIPTPAEVEKLFIDAESRGANWWLYLKIAIATGARPGEVCALRRVDLDLDRHTIRIEWSADRVSGRIKRPKTLWSVRTLHLHPDFFAALLPLLPGDPTAYLFPANTYRGSRSPLPCWNSRSVKRRLDAAIDRTGLRHITPNAFRHFAATHLLDEGWAPIQVARFLGHANDTLVRSLYANHIVDETQKGIGRAASRLVFGS